MLLSLILGAVYLVNVAEATPTRRPVGKRSLDDVTDDEDDVTEEEMEKRGLGSFFRGIKNKVSV